MNTRKKMSLAITPTPIIVEVDNPITDFLSTNPFVPSDVPIQKVVLAKAPTTQVVKKTTIVPAKPVVKPVIVYDDFNF